ncbi:MAG: hypothetical protein KDF58_07150 [Alphaproteobacteria bacterium]|nr:hypothetical protein [Alphaproteobacteria bacterium]HPF45410.1 ClpXP protease specificity-enhancing factor SspB [Emcibacteraceae bacterium]HRW28535.1 ClpXP protease specificity-enhancing factor SspB [Emcibacteraceae bacterium]
MTDSIIKYDEMVQAALIGVVRDILKDTAANGLPGEHHFYITFQTTHPNVKIPKYLKERYEEDMTIVLQNQFWDLSIDDDHFEISLSFNRNKEHLSIPFDSLLGFFDPSVDFGLHFNTDVDAKADLPEKDNNDQKIEIVEEKIEIPAEKDNIVTLDAFRKK